jgi:hypothetical protein
VSQERIASQQYISVTVISATDILDLESLVLGFLTWFSDRLFVTFPNAILPPGFEFQALELKQYSWESFSHALSEGKRPFALGFPGMHCPLIHGFHIARRVARMDCR